jgi:hypothetical protein
MHPLQSSLHPSTSTPDLTVMSAVPPDTNRSVSHNQAIPSKIIPPEGELLHIHTDPRTPSSASTVSRNDSLVESSHHPDLNDEVSKLNEKLIDAINHQASLDESLQQSRSELEAARLLISKLEENARQQRKKAEENEARVAKELASEKGLRSRAELDKKTMEQELETLTSALFTEANNMVADARREKEASDKKVEQLRSQLQDSEVLLQSHQDQLTDLKMVLEKITAEEDDNNESTTQSSSVPPTSPTMTPHDKSYRGLDATAYGHNELGTIEVMPEHPLHFSHIIQPVLRTDIAAYTEFAALMKQATAASPPSSRVVSGSYSSLSVGGGAGTGSPSQIPSPAIGAFPSLTTNISPRTSTNIPQAPVLRETKVFKRALIEDIEPTLRLDIAPGVSWMVRRPIVTSMIDGSLVVEPMPPSPLKGRGPVNQCSLCGENRVGEPYNRKHRFRISEDKESKRFPLCDLCLGRLRSCCELLSFLRMVIGGHWKADSDDEVKSAWEEYVKLRERMFWHRMAGGVVPVHHHARELVTTSPRPSLDTVEAVAGATRDTTLEPSQSQDSEQFITPDATPQPTTEVDPIAAMSVSDSSNETSCRQRHELDIPNASQPLTAGAA